MNNLFYIASAIQNRISAGLKGTVNEPYSVEQIIDEVLVIRSALLKNEEDAGKLKYEDVIETLSCIKLDCEDLSMCCSMETYDKTKHFKMPKASSYITDPIKYIGLVDRSDSFSIIKGSKVDLSAVNYTKFNKYLKSKTLVWIHPNREDGFIFNPPTEELEVITIDFVPENPTDLYNYSCCTVNNFEEDAKSIPNWMVSSIMDKITNDFGNFMYRLSYKRNDGTGH